MKRAALSTLWVSCFVVWSLAPLPVQAALSDDPYVTKKLAHKLRTLPFSYFGKRSLVLRAKHVNSVNYLGDGILSKFGYVKKEGVIRHGLWLRLKNDGPEGWSNGTVFLKKPIKANRYNSIVLWVRASEANQKFWMTVQDEEWTNAELNQARTDVIPAQGLPKNKVVELVIPYQAIFAEYPLDYSKINRIGFEFGEQTVGNRDASEIEILGIAFIKQDKFFDFVRYIEYPPPKRSKGKRGLIRGPDSVPGEMDVAADQYIAKNFLSNQPFQPIFFKSQRGGVVVYSKPKTRSRKMGRLKLGLAYLANKSIRSRGKRWFYLQTAPKTGGWVKGSDLTLANVRIPHTDTYPKPQLAKKPHIIGEALEVKTKALKKKQQEAFEQELVEKLVSEYTTWEKLVHWFTKEPPAERVIQKAEAELEAEEGREPSELVGFFQAKGLLGTYPRLWDFVGLFLLLCAVAYYVIRKKRTPFDWPHIDKLIQEMNWPFTTAEWGTNVTAEKNFWRKRAEERVSYGWLSTSFASLKRDSNEEYHGENFLARQVKLASECKIELIPSFCFVRTVFNYDTFLNNPEFYMYKPVPISEHHLSDEELRMKYVGYFPVWVPPYWQKEKGLAQRILVAFGKMPGSMFMTDSVQYNLTSATFRSMVIRVLRRIAKKSSAIRIEGAASLLNSSLKMYWNNQLHDDNKLHKHEFWKDVIRAVKKEKPNLIFISDSVGGDLDSIHDVGFDYFENDRLREIMINQIRLEMVGNLNYVLYGEKQEILSRSIHTVTPLLKSLPSHPTLRTQNLLCAAIMSMLPGRIAYDGRSVPDFKDFLTSSMRWPGLRNSHFALIGNKSESVLSFARWAGKNLLVVVANFSSEPQKVNLPLMPLASAFEDRKLYLFTDLLHGSNFLREIKDQRSTGPVWAVSGQDLRGNGLAINLSGLSLKVISVNLTRNIQSSQVIRGESVLK